MPDWKETYAASLRLSELRQPVDMELVQSCSQMADRIAALEAEQAVLAGDLAKLTTKTDPPAAAPDANTTSEDSLIAQLRSHLAESLRSKGVAEARLRTAEEELARLRTKTREDSLSVQNLDSHRTALSAKLRDRDHELREKRKLLEHVQDEMIALNLQLSMVEKERDKVKDENRQLVDRWMKRMAQEADAMNLANEPIFDKG